MKLAKVLGLAAVGALLAVAAPTERANAVSLMSPGAAAAVPDDASQAAIEVHYHRGWHSHHHHRWDHRRHWRRW
jgi:hypothetical protein